MTEAKWLAATRPAFLLDDADSGATERKRRLFACACCRRIWNLLSAECLRQAVEEAEQLADGLISEDRLVAIRQQVKVLALPYGHINFSASCVEYTVGEKGIVNGYTAAAYAAEGLAFRVAGRAWSDVYTEEMEKEYRTLMVLLRDILVNPFRPVTFEPEWRTSTVVSVAQSMYESRDFSPMPLLADALQDADCENMDILNHCRSAGPHVRGCWVVDLILGKN